MRNERGQSGTLRDDFRDYLHYGGLPGLLHGELDTVLDYLRMLCEAYILHRVPRFDIRGRRHLEVNDKFYLGDIELRHGSIGYRESDIGGMLENLVYLELRRRGYDVSVGTYEDREIDFVATRPPGERLYVQVAYLLERSETIDRETAPLLSVGDAYPKQILTLDEHRPGELHGITHRNIPEWLNESR